MSGTHRDLLFRSKSRSSACKNHRWRLGPIETCNSGPKVALLNAQNHRSGLGPIETSNSGANRAVLHLQNDRWGLVPIKTFILVLSMLCSKPQTACIASELLVSRGLSLHMWFSHAKQRLLDQNNKSLWVADITCRFVHENSVISTWITCLYGSQPSAVVFACKTATLAPEWQVDMGPRPYLSFCACKRARIVPELQVSVGPRPHLSFCALKTVCLASELLVSLGLSPQLWFLDAQQWHLDENNNSLPVPDITCRFVHAKQRD